MYHCTCPDELAHHTCCVSLQLFTPFPFHCPFSLLHTGFPSVHQRPLLYTRLFRLCSRQIPFFIFPGQPMQGCLPSVLSVVNNYTIEICRDKGTVCFPALLCINHPAGGLQLGYQTPRALLGLNRVNNRSLQFFNLRVTLSQEVCSQTGLVASQTEAS